MLEKNGASTAGILRWALLLAALCFVLWALSDLLLVAFAAVLLATLLRGAARALARIARLPTPIALLLVAVTVIAVFAGLAYLVGPRLIDEGERLGQELYAVIAQLRARYDHTTWGAMLEQAFSSRGVAGIVPLAPKVLTVTFGTAVRLAVLVVIGVYLAMSPDIYINGAVRLVPIHRRGRAREILSELGRVLRSWMLGQLVDMAAVGVIATVGLSLLHVPLPFALGALAGLLTFIPYVGAILAAIPALIIASTVGFATILWVLLLYIGCHIVEGYLIAPFVARRTVHLPPALTILSMSILGTLYGFFGVLIATPLTATLIVLIREIYVRDILGDQG